MAVTTVGKRIYDLVQDYCTEHKMTMREFTDAIGIGRTAPLKWKAGSTPMPDTMRRLKNAGIDVEMHREVKKVKCLMNGCFAPVKEQKIYCGICGFNAEEAERRKEIPFVIREVEVDMGDGNIKVMRLRTKILNKSERDGHIDKMKELYS